MLLKPIFIGTLETALNQYLSLDANASVFLAPMAGKVIAVTILPFAETIYLCPASDRIQLLDSFPEQADTQLTGTLWALGLMGLSGKPMRALFSGEVRIEGDTNTGRQFQELFAKLDIDWESKLARYTGEQFAQQLGGFFRASHHWGKDALENFRLNTAEFLQEETRDLPPAPEINIFYHQVDKIRTDADRLNSRLERLAALLAAKASENPER